MGRSSRADSFAKEGETLRASFNSATHDTIFDMLLKVTHAKSPSAFDDPGRPSSFIDSSADYDMYDLMTFNHREPLKNKMATAFMQKTKKKSVSFAEPVDSVEWVEDLQYKFPETPLPYSLFGTRRDIGYEEEEQLLAPAWSRALPYSAVDFGCFQMQMHSRSEHKSFFLTGPVHIHHVTCMGVSWKTYIAGLASGILVFSYEDDAHQVFACPIHKCRIQILDDTQLKLYEVAGLREVDELFLQFANPATLYLWFWAIQVAAATPLYSDPDEYTKALRRLRSKQGAIPPPPSPSSSSNSFWSSLGNKLGLGKPVSGLPNVTLPIKLQNPKPRNHIYGLSPSHALSAVSRRILFIRHGDYHNVHFKTADAEKTLTPEGEENARRTGVYLQELIEEAGLTYRDVQLVYSTDTRTIQTMDLIAKEIDKSAGVYETFNPYETQSKKNRVARHEFALLRESVPHGLSPARKFLCRSAKMSLALQAICSSDATTTPITVVICSSSFIRYCVHQAAYGVGFVSARVEMNQSIVIGHCSVTQIDVDEDNALLLRGVNQLGHLAPPRGHNPQDEAPERP
ncbi:unnamed protein product [Aphanomyces euteiches]|uniref:Serine/threonine-protein phosphatase PGAM5, mitochondrial n=1 Tax=Aphanomyces euteiches TaxID=100861 RepID=A0A6G0XX30_9STRA|nr:hypothetical protein Ae201684_000320 [Aphanomyces euteiches]KAH9091546.1 hypothetical protein Ae201684P_011091 [Aphanomyces euteiches]KAH9139989.1 hypothetical protein AeRB84_015764 [Aphanomyces euteiches]